MWSWKLLQHLGATRGEAKTRPMNAGTDGEDREKELGHGASELTNLGSTLSQGFSIMGDTSFPSLFSQGFSTFTLLTFLVGWFFIVRSCPVCCRMLGSIPGLHPPDAHSIPPSLGYDDQVCLQTFSMSLWMSNQLWSRTTGLSPWFPNWSVHKMIYWSIGL